MILKRPSTTEEIQTILSGKDTNDLKNGEVFFFGEQKVLLLNPVNFELDLEYYYKELFSALASASRAYLQVEDKLKDFEFQKKITRSYLDNNSATEVKKATDLSYTTVCELKSGKEAWRRYR